VAKKNLAKVKKNLKTTTIKSAPQKIEVTTGNLRIPKSNEAKPEIKKVKNKKQKKRIQS